MSELMDDIEPTSPPKGASERKTLLFPAPVQFAGQDFSQIVLREPTASEILATRRAPLVDREVLLVHRVAGVPQGVVKQLGIGLITEADTWLWRWAAEDGLPDDGLPATLTFPLRQAVTLNGQSYSALSLREPTADQMREIRTRDLDEQQIVAIAVVGGVPEEAVRKIGIRDAVRAERYLVGFINAGRRAGGA